MGREDRAGLMQTSDLDQRWDGPPALQLPEPAQLPPQHLAQGDYQPETRRRLNRNEKKETGWRVPDPKQGKGKVAQAVETFLCNLTRPVEQRDEPLPRKTNKGSEVSNSGQQKERTKEEEEGMVLSSKQTNTQINTNKQTNKHKHYIYSCSFITCVRSFISKLYIALPENICAQYL